MSFVLPISQNPEQQRKRLNTILAAIEARLPLTGVGSPEGALAASVGRLYTRTDGGAGSTLYVKETGTGNTGWAAK